MRSLAIVCLYLAGMVVTQPLAGQSSAEDLKRMQGTWKAILLEVDGRASTEEERTKVDIRLRVQGDKYTVSFEDKEVTSGTLRLDPAKKPPQIDAQIATGPNPGKSMPGIYTFEGEVMKVCFAQPGQPRPTEFKTRDGSLQTLLRYERIDKDK